jgi:predicted regulator of Ras-like GTPase activity (Roadblock/LC7/MglB family)
MVSRTNTRTRARKRTEAPDEAILALLRALSTDVRGVRGALIATNDGHAVAAHAVDDDAAAAAIVASARGIGDRLADLCGDGDLQEIVVRSSTGYAVVYSAGPHAALTVLTDETTNLALLHLRARVLTSEIGEALDASLAD